MSITIKHQCGFHEEVKEIEEDERLTLTPNARIFIDLEDNSQVDLGFLSGVYTPRQLVEMATNKAKGQKEKAEDTTKKTRAVYCIDCSNFCSYHHEAGERACYIDTGSRQYPDGIKRTYQVSSITKENKDNKCPNFKRIWWKLWAKSKGW